MSFIKLTDLPVLTAPDANTYNTTFVVVDRSSGVFTTKQLSLANLDIAIDNTANIAYDRANSGFAQSNSAYAHANAAYNQANVSIPAFAHANAAFNPLYFFKSPSLNFP